MGRASQEMGANEAVAKKCSEEMVQNDMGIILTPIFLQMLPTKTNYFTVAQLIEEIPAFNTEIQEPKPDPILSQHELVHKYCFPSIYIFVSPVVSSGFPGKIWCSFSHLPRKYCIVHPSDLPLFDHLYNI